MKTVEVAIIGAGSAGLAALAEVREVTSDFIVVDDGPLGTLCARAGCMPSKVLIQVANDFFRGRRLNERGIRGGKNMRLNIPEALSHVRGLRDRFAGEVVRSTKRLGRRLIRGRARFAGPRVLRVGKREYFAKRVVLATGSRPVVPKEYQPLGDRVVTTDALFERKDLPRRIGVIGLGPVGLEIGQALSRLGCEVRAFDRSRALGKLSDPAVNACALRHFAKEFEIRLGRAVTVKARGKALEISCGGRAYAADLILASLGRRPNLDDMGLETLGVALNEQGVPDFDPETMKVPGLPIFLAGDAGVLRPVLHEAADGGRIAGYNCVHRPARRFERRAPLAITFNEPNLALVGASFAELKRGTFVTGRASFTTQARALILGENYGLLHVYAGAAEGKFLGAEMIGPAGEHLAHLMAWALQRKLTVYDMLRLPFYHPTVEEGLRDALRDAARRLKSRGGYRELAFSPRTQ